MIAPLLVSFALVAAAGAPTPPGAAAPAAAQAKPRKLKMAVLDCRPVGAADPKTIEGLSSLLVTEVSSRPELQVIGSSDMRALIGFDRERALLGCTESSCLAEIGGALGVDYLVSSEGSKVGSSWLLTLTLLDTSKSVAVKRVTKRTTSDDQLIDAAVQGVHELLGALPNLAPSASPASANAATEPGKDAVVESGQKPGYRTHDGFYLHVALGGGALGSSWKAAQVGGPANSFALALGHSVGDHLVLYGQLVQAAGVGPNVSIGSVDRELESATHTLLGVGAGAAWYFLRYNVYVAATLGVGGATLDWKSVNFGTESVQSGNGLIFRADLGKEWWLSANWGLGIAAQLTSLNTTRKDDGTTITSAAYGLALSATYN